MPAAADTRLSPAETRYATADVRAFITQALSTAPAVERVQELLVRHVVAGELHPSVVQEDLVGLIGDIVGAATEEDWSAITDRLIAEARDALLDDEPATAAHAR
jgi:hypothetical protein